MSKYRKKPVVIEARQFINDESAYRLLRWINESRRGAFATWINGALIIPTLEGDHKVTVGDWIIQGVQGEFYPCKPDIFNDTYEKVK